MCYPHFLDENVSKLLRLYQTDMSLAQIAQHLHVSQTTLQAKIKELGQLALHKKP